MRKLLLCCALGSGVGLSGCAGPFKQTLNEQAKVTQGVADTINKALSSIKCDLSQVDVCQSAIAVISSQTKILKNSSETLSKAGAE